MMIACGAEGLPSGPSLQPQLQTGRQGLRVGQPREGYPNHDEQLMLVAINRSRSDPNNVALETAGACPTTGSAWRAPLPPLMWSFEGSRAARFHGAHAALNGGGLSHESYCDLRPDVGTNGCAGEASCSCTFRSGCWSCDSKAGCGTDPFERGRLFGFPAQNEVLAANQSDGWTANRAWITECIGEDGHRLILTSDGQDSIGVGGYRGGSCWQRHWGANGAHLAVPLAVLPAGVHRDLGGGRIAYYVNYHEPSGGPLELDLVLDGACLPMSREIGTPENGTWWLELADDGQCHQYWFRARGPDGARHTWPEVGAWRSGACEGFVAQALPADCESCTEGETIACGLGRCAGEATCSGGAFGACAGPAPEAESCNGEDDDCDGHVPAEEYDHDLDGYSACEGDCDDHDPDLAPGVEELCNRIDDDCDGVTDEGCGEPDGGPGPDGGTVPPEEPKGCGCEGTSRSAAGVVAWLLLVGATVGRRRL
ncbi:MAG: MopE-related protein [Deltaproteobacteria bacterium]|nr:MopE-related protein [Deltaproteobacteria bacterium]